MTIAEQLPRWVWRLPFLVQRRRAAIAVAIRRELPAERQKRRAKRVTARGTVRYDLGEDFLSAFAPRNCRSTIIGIDTGEPPAPPAPRLPPGRQAVDVGPWDRPPPHARCAPWADLHHYPKGVDRQIDPRAAMVGQVPPTSLECPGCELQLQPLYRDRSCPYCGLKFDLRGPVVFFWREAIEVKPWKPVKR